MIADERLYKYPRTPHVSGSRLQPGDEDLPVAAFRQLQGRFLVIEEKLDGANAAISFDSHGRLRLQSRGHYLRGGGRERHFAMFKQWANHHSPSLYAILGSRYILYGEWLYAKHTMYYNSLPHYFLEFDLLDTHTGTFLATSERHSMLSDAPVVSVPVLHRGTLSSSRALTELLGPSCFITKGHLEELASVAAVKKLDVSRVLSETDPQMIMEGLYIKEERNGAVVERYKFVRQSFSAVVDVSGSHWQSRPIIPNGLSSGADLYGTTTMREADGAAPARVDQ